MVDIFALALSHGLLALAAWRLLMRPDLDRDDAGRGPDPAHATRKGPRRMVVPGRREAGDRDAGGDA